MFPCKLLLQSLITVPKNLQIYTAATVNSSKLSGHTRANFHNAPCVENCKNGTIKNIFNNTGIDRRKNEINTKCSSFLIPVEVYKKVRKVNHNSQITKNIHQRTKTNIQHSKSRNFHQNTRKSSTARNGNRILKPNLEISQSTVRFISSRTGILPPPSNGNSKNIVVTEDADEIPSYKINIKFHGTIPPPTSRNDNIIHNQCKDLPETTFNITMSKGRKIRPPSGTEKRCMSTGRIIKANTFKKLNDYNLLKNKESLLTTLNCFIHTTKPLTGEQKSKSIVNLNNLSKQIEENKQKEIYYKQHFPNQPFPCSLYKTNDYRLDESRINEFKKNRHFIKSYLRPVNLPPPTPKKLKVQTSDSSLPPVYSLEVMQDLTPTSMKQKSKSPLLNLLVQTKRAVENVQLENNPLPLNFNFPMSEGMQNDFESEDDRKKSIYVKQLDHDLRNSVNENKYMVDDQMTNEIRKSHILSFNSNDGKTNFGSGSRTINDDTDKSLDNYNTSSDALKTLTNEYNKNNSPRTAEEQENTMYNETSNTIDSSEAINSSMQDKPENKLNTMDNQYLGSTWSKSDSVSKNDDPTQMNRDIYHTEDNQGNKDNYQTSNMNNEMSSEINDSDVNKIQDNQENNQNFSNMNNVSSIERNDNVHKMGVNQENKFNFQAFDLSNSLSSKISDNVNRMDENKAFQASSMNHMVSTEINDRSMPKIDESQEIKVNFQASNMNNAMPTELSHSSMPKLEENQDIKVNFQASNMNNQLSTGLSDSSLPKMDETQENKLNYQNSNMNHMVSPEINDSSIVPKGHEIQENKVNYPSSNINMLSTERSDSNVNKMNEHQENKVNFEAFGENNPMPTVAENSNINSESTDSNYNNNTSNIKQSPINSYFRTSSFINSDISEPISNHLSSYGENLENKVNMQASSRVNNVMETMNKNVPKVEESQVVDKANMQASSGIYNTMGTMNNNLPKIEETQARNQYFNAPSNVGMNAYSSEANQTRNENAMSPNMQTDATNEHGIDTPMSIPNMLSNRFRKTKSRRPEKGLMNSFSFMKNSKGLSELAKSFNHASVFIPKQSLWRKFKFPAPAPSTYEEANIGSSFKPVEKEKKIPKFKNFSEARNYFVQPENLKKLTPSQVAMYNSILYYENVIKKHSEEMSRQRDNLESTQQTLKHRKHKFFKNRTNFDE